MQKHADNSFRNGVASDIAITDSRYRCRGEIKTCQVQLCACLVTCEVLRYPRDSVDSSVLPNEDPEAAKYVAQEDQNKNEEPKPFCRLS